MEKVKIKVTETDVTISRLPEKITAGNIEFIDCEFDLAPVFSNLIVRASFNDAFRTIENGVCKAPELNEGICKLGVYGYELDDNGEYQLCVSPKPTTFFVNEGSFNDKDIPADNPAPSELESHYALINALVESGKLKGEQGPQGEKGDPGTTDYNDLLHKPRELYTPPDNKNAQDNPFGDASVVYLRDIIKILNNNDRGTPNGVFDITEDFYLLADENWEESMKGIYVRKGDILAIEYQGSTDGWSYITLFDEQGVYAFHSYVDNWMENGLLINVSILLELLAERDEKIEFLTQAVKNLNENVNELKSAILSLGGEV